MRVQPENLAALRGGRGQVVLLQPVHGVPEPVVDLLLDLGAARGDRRRRGRLHGVVGAAADRVGKGAVGFDDGDEALVRGLLIGRHVRVMIAHQLPIAALDLVGAGAPRDSQDPVVIGTVAHHRRRYLSDTQWTPKSVQKV